MSDWYVCWMLPRSLPNLLELSLMSLMARSTISAAACVSPPSDWMSEADIIVACSMYEFADTPAVLYASLAYCWMVPAESLKRISTPPTICS